MFHIDLWNDGYRQNIGMQTKSLIPIPMVWDE